MRRITGPERDALILTILKRLEESKPHADAMAWERGWKESLERFRKNPGVSALIPAFIKPDQPVRYQGEFWDGGSELEHVHEVHEWLARELFHCRTVYEFGCGTGYNLVRLADMLNADFCGFDRSQNAVALVREASSHLNLPIVGERFDMLEPAPFILPANTGVFTFGAMEQLGNFKPFIDYLIRSRPSIVCHVEPIPELLDAAKLVDWLSLKFHEKRGYTVGLLPYLRERVEVLKVERSHFGSLMLESYARIVWRPR